MGIKFFTPKGKDAIEAGTIIDDDGQRYILIGFTDEAGDKIMVNMPIPLFRDFSDHIAGLAEKVGTRDYWRNHPRG